MQGFCFYRFPAPQQQSSFWAIEMHMPLKPGLMKKTANNSVSEFPDTSAAAAMSTCREHRETLDEAGRSGAARGEALGFS